MTRFAGAGLMGALLCAGLAFTALPAGAQGQGAWRIAAQMTTTRTDIGVVEYGGKLYVMGGQAMGRTDSQMAQEFDPATGRWRDLAPLPKGASHVGVAAMNGKIYVAGGFLANVHKDPQTSFAEYDIASNTWRTLAPLPRPLGAAGLAALNGKLHLVGGRGPDAKTTGTHAVYDPASNTWTNAAPLPVARDHLGIVTMDGKIYVIGGRTDQTVDNTGLADAYDPSTDKWTSLTPMPTKRSSGALGVYRGRLVFVGGECKNPQTRMTFDENEAYDPKTNSWASLAKPNTGLHAGGWAAVGDSLYFFGGNTGCGGDGPSNAVYAFRLP